MAHEIERGADDEYLGPERRLNRQLSDADIDRIVEQVIERAGVKIAQQAAKHALDEVYADVGKGVLKKFAWLLAVAFICLLIWFGKNHVDFTP
jgi:hypothetical protein